jgi:hypothetical protein
MIEDINNYHQALLRNQRLRTANFAKSFYCGIFVIDRGKRLLDKLRRFSFVIFY